MFFSIGRVERLARGAKRDDEEGSSSLIVWTEQSFIIDVQGVKTLKYPCGSYSRWMNDGTW